MLDTDDIIAIISRGGSSEAVKFRSFRVKVKRDDTFKALAAAVSAAFVDGQSPYKCSMRSLESGSLQR